MKSFESCISSFSKMNEASRQICLDTFREVSLEIQTKKLNQSGILDEVTRNNIISSLNVRPALLVHIAESLRSDTNKMQVFAEVGTAQGLQACCFARNFENSLVHTCDIKDDRENLTKNLKNIVFTLGTSQKMESSIDYDRKIDFCWIDGAHDSYSVIEDFISLFHKSHSETIWAFDDFDERFGCYKDISLIAGHFRERIAIDLGLTASGNPNRIMLARGFQC